MQQSGEKFPHYFKGVIAYFSRHTKKPEDNVIPSLKYQRK